MTDLHITLLVIVLTLQMLDAFTTYTAINGNKGAECNVFAAAIFKRLGLIPGIVAMKAPFVAALYFYHAEVGDVALVVISLIYAVVVYSNVKIIRAAT
jgi:hypothetical protein